MTSQDEEEEESEELAPLTSSTCLESKTLASDRPTTPSGRSNSLIGSHNAMCDIGNDEFSLGISFVKKKTGKALTSALQVPVAMGGGSRSIQQGKASGNGASGLSNSRRVKMSDWDVDQDASSMNRYKGSAALDDTDAAKDISEYQAWKVRDAQRDKGLLSGN